MADAAFDFLGDAGMRASDTTDAVARAGRLKQEEDAFAAAVSVWKSKRGTHFRRWDKAYSLYSALFLTTPFLFPIAIQLPTIQQEMDTQSVELLEQQQHSLAGRKKLAELTRGTVEGQSYFIILK